MNVEQIRDRSDVGLVRREIREFAENAGFDAISLNNLDIAVSEGVTNLLRHAGGGLVLYGMNRGGERDTLEVAFVDSGGGIPRVEKALEDGFSTSNGLGQGLGAMQRLADDFDIFSQVGKGTVVAIGFKRSNDMPGEADRRSGLPMAGLTFPLHGQAVSGDGWAAWSDTNRTRVILCDGLGHGQGAHDATTIALSSFRESVTLPLDAAFEAMHADLEGSRGIACLAVEMEHDKLPTIFCLGVGNIAGHILAAGKVRQVMSFDGTLGKQIRRLTPQVYDDVDWTAVVLATDGLKSRWKITDHPGLLLHSPLTIVATLWRDYHRGTDDAGVVAIKRPPA